jgi:hypothetical protein
MTYVKRSATPGCVFNKQIDLPAFRSWCVAAGLTHSQHGAASGATTGAVQALSSMQLDATFKQCCKYLDYVQNPGLVMHALTFDAFLAACDKLAFLRGVTKDELMFCLAAVEYGNAEGSGSPGLITANRLFTRRT